MSLSPRQAFLDNIRPAELLLRVHSLLACDKIETSGQIIQTLRPLIGASADESLMLIYNEVFLGLIRENAQLPQTTFKRSGMDNLLRQAVVAACTGLDAYLPALLRENLPSVIAAKGRDFFPQDNALREYFKDLTFDLSDTLRLLGDPNAPLFIANKILGLTSFKYLSSRNGVHAVGALLAIDSPWDEIAGTLQRDKKELMRVIEETTRRRNDIVHRADRPQSDPGGEPQEIGFAWTQQSVDTIKHVCLALDELVDKRMQELRAGIELEVSV